MNYSNLRSQILAAIKYPPKISAASLQEQLINIVNGLDLGALLLGVATPLLAPNTEANGFYFALQSGTYTNFPTINGQTITVDSSEVAIIVRSGNYWSKIHITTYPTIDPTTKHWMIGNEDTGVIAEGVTPHIDPETGNWFIGTNNTGIHAQGADAVNPFKGWYDADITGEEGSKVVVDTANLPTDPVVGDYAYVKTLEISGTAPEQTETPVVKIYECATNGVWSDSGRTPDTSKVQTFKTSQELSDTSIDNTNLTNPVECSLANAKDAMQLKGKLRGIPREETEPTITNINGKYVGIVNSQWTLRAVSGSKAVIIEIPAGTTAVRFLGWYANVNGAYGWCFGNYDAEATDNIVFVQETGRRFYYKTSLQSGYLYEYEIAVPEGVNRLAIVIKYSNSFDLTDDFYAYLVTGDNVKQMINKVSFKTGELTKDVSIDDVCDEGKNTDVPSARVVSSLKNKVSEITFEEVEPAYTEEAGYIRGADGDITTGSGNHATFNVEGWDKVRFLGVIYKNTTSAGWSFYDANGNAIGYEKYTVNSSLANPVTTEIIRKVPQNAVTFKASFNIASNVLNEDNFYCYLSKGNTLDSIIKEQVDEQIASFSETITMNDGVIKRLPARNNILLSDNPTLFLIGASFGDPRNGWFEIACNKLNASGVNVCVPGSSIIEDANKAYAGILWTAAQLEAMDALIIMHVLNYNVMYEPALKDTIAEYEAQMPFDTTRNRTNMTMAYDYLIKKYIAECYALRNNQSSQYYGTVHGKPAQIAVCTSWHDDRTTFNNAIRKISATYNLTLVDFSANIGFSKDRPLDDGTQVSIIYALDDGENRETIEGVQYGWHPDQGQTKFIQKKMAKIFESYLK